MRLVDPRPPAWQVRQEREQAKRDRKRRVEVEEDRREFAAHRAELVSGTLGWIVGPAQSYLGIRGRGSRELPPRERLVDWLGDSLAADALTGLEAALHRADLPTVAQVTTGFAEDVTYNFCFAIMAGLLERQRAGVKFGGVSAEVLLTGLLLCHHDRGWCSDDDLAELRSALEALLLPTLEARVAFARVWIEPSLTAGREHVNGLYMLSHGEGWQPTGGALADGWLTRFPDVPQSVEVALIECLTHAGELGKLRAVAEARSGRVFRNEDHLLTWLAVDVLVRFEEVRADIAGIGMRHPEFIWFLRNRIQLERRGAMLPTSVAQAAWIWSEFRAAWPSATLEGSGSGNTNDYDATDFLRALLSRLADDGTEEAAAALQALIAGPGDSYSELIRHMAAEQQQKRAEESFAPVSAGRLGQLLDDGPPGNIDDLKTLVLEELEVAQAKLRGEDVDQVRDFWSDAGIPYGENRCRDRLAAMIGTELMRYGIQRITEADMPMTKRVDLAFARGPLQLPLEVKGQWHAEVWDAATGQLDLQYLIDWRSEQRGVYCVLWFGEFVAITGASGSGKSTFMSLLGCLDTPTRGELSIEGRRTAHMTGNELASLRNRRFGFVFQQFSLLPRTTAVDNVALPLAYAGVPMRERRHRAAERLRELGLADRLDHTPSRLSGGQQQRVAIARALVGDPALLLADEPTGALDSRTTDEIMSLLATLNRGGLTIILVTHEREVADWAARRLTFADGRIVDDRWN